MGCSQSNAQVTSKKASVTAAAQQAQLKDSEGNQARQAPEPRGLPVAKAPASGVADSANNNEQQVEEKKSSQAPPVDSEKKAPTPAKAQVDAEQQAAMMQPLDASATAKDLPAVHLIVQEEGGQQRVDEEPSAAGAEDTSGYISTDKLAELIESTPRGSLCILNASFKPDGDVFEEHARAHIPGAIHFDLGVLPDAKATYPHKPQNQAHFVRIMKALDIRKSQTVVVYETGKGMFATRAAFLLKTFGHPKVHLLDGNFGKWQSEGRPVESDLAEGEDWSTEFSYELTENGGNVLPYERINEVSADASIQVIDSRPAPGFEAGNVTNSINVPAPTLLSQEDGTIKSDNELRELYEAKGVDLSKPMVFSCGGGIMATLSYMTALHANLSSQVYVYDGSWSEYNARKKQEQEQE